MCFCSSESDSGGQCPGLGAHPGPGAGAVEPEASPEGPGHAEHAGQDEPPAGGLREPAGCQAGAGHGDQRLPEDAGGRGAEVRMT